MLTESQVTALSQGARQAKGRGEEGAGRARESGQCAPARECPGCGVGVVPTGPGASPPARAGSPTHSAEPRVGARRAWKSRPPGAPATFSRGAGRASGLRAPRPSRTETGRRGRAARVAPASRSAQLRALPAPRARRARRCPVPSPAPQPGAPSAHPERHRELALQEEKQRQIQPHGSDPQGSASRRRDITEARPTHPGQQTLGQVEQTAPAAHPLVLAEALRCHREASSQLRHNQITGWLCEQEDGTQPLAPRSHSKSDWPPTLWTWM
ncbi:MICAL-like protein 1 [Camelus ferus]|uniref:MICAL-like protein 1 n=1 Tax=Camelus ferus TaxID=419612 RepID=A0A8B8RG75_CAMFR|nr:MICAL-like protein 1 [Camelus ferus]